MWHKQCVLVCLYVMCVSRKVVQRESVSWKALLGNGEVLACLGFPGKLSEVVQARVIVHSL